MKLARLIVAPLMVAWLASDAQAQSLRNAKPPAETPPASFKSDQYVDSRGCVYIRAGRGVNEAWIPQVDRQRRQVCGYFPSLSASEIAKAKAQQNQRRLQAPKVITLEPDG